MSNNFSFPELPGGAAITRPMGLLYISALRIILYQVAAGDHLSNLAPALELAHRLISLGLDCRAIPIAIETLLVRDQMYCALGDHSACRQDVLSAVKLAQPEGFITLFLEEGEGVLKILAGILDDPLLEHAVKEHIEKIIAVSPQKFHSPPEVRPAPVQKRDGLLLEPLSKRELEILRLIADGWTNNEIAERQVITLHTVKKHCSNIYGKLGVRNRTQAVAKARELGLLK